MTIFRLILLLITLNIPWNTFGQKDCNLNDLVGEWKLINLSNWGAYTNIDSLKLVSQSHNSEEFLTIEFFKDSTFTFRSSKNNKVSKGYYFPDEKKCELILNKNKKRLKNIKYIDRNNWEVIYVNKDILIYKEDNNPFNYATHILVFGQNSTFLKTTDRKNLHYIELCDDYVKVYKMGRYYDKAGIGSAIIKTDTLFRTIQNEFKGKFYTLLKNETIYTLISDNEKKYQTELESGLKVYRDLNNAYCLKSYFDLSSKLNKEFPLYHYTFRNGYYAWEKQPNKSINHGKFTAQIDQEIALIYDQMSIKQTAFTKTTKFITDNITQSNYSILKDSLSTLPMEYQSQSGYFYKSVYQMVKANPEYFYKILQDFPTSRQYTYAAVEQDKELIKNLKQVRGYEGFKKEFFKEYNFRKTLPYRIIGTYAIIAGLFTWLMIAKT